MIKVFDSNGAANYLATDDYYIRRLQTGINELVFNIDARASYTRQVVEEAIVQEASEASVLNEYVVKAIDGNDKTLKVKCTVNVDDWKGTILTEYSRTGTLAEIVEDILPDGWALLAGSSATAVSGTVELDVGTPLDVLLECINVFPGATYEIDAVDKDIVVNNRTNADIVPSLASRELNITGSDYKGKSTSFATRLYATGKDGLTFASINDGKPYVDNNTYSNKIICATASNTQIEDAAELLAWATAELAVMAQPARSYNYNLADLWSANTSKYSWLQFPLMYWAPVIDTYRNSEIIYLQIIERWIYPYHPEKNRTIFNSAAPRLQSQVAALMKGAK